MDVVEPATAQHLFKIMRSVELVGCKELVSGIRPSVAKIMVELGIELSTLVTYPTLVEALRRWINRRAAAAVCRPQLRSASLDLVKARPTS
ncbi:hypothetical protein [Sorangium sp. So ce128]|uniref:hypothetical protein n=1 Tax=Sorangium sp. So ce128 TaxID=3133281 RepID=UPI003F5DC4E6